MREYAWLGVTLPSSDRLELRQGIQVFSAYADLPIRGVSSGSLFGQVLALSGA